MNVKEYLGELLGTFILVFVGCGSIAVTILFQTFGSLLEVALVWGVGVAIAIYATKNICPAHLNPAVSVAMCWAKKLSLKKLPGYILSQTVGAFLAGFLLYAIFKGDIASYEQANGIIRGSLASQETAMMFGEFFPNPGYKDTLKITVLLACLMELLGTFTLVFSIFKLTETKLKIEKWVPVFIGLTVTLIICVVAPYTQAGLNPARDFGPRVLAYFAGWNLAAFPQVSFSFFTVYIVSPVVGGIAAFYVHSFFKASFFKQKNKVLKSKI